MSTTDALIEELRAAPDELVIETRDFFQFIKSRRQAAQPAQSTQFQLPDFEARMKSIFGNRVIADSLPWLVESREDRFS